MFRTHPIVHCKISKNGGFCRLLTLLTVEWVGSSVAVDQMKMMKKKEKFGGGDCEAPNRYPYLGAEDISSVTRVEDIPAPYVATPVVSGNRAKVEVFPAGNNKISNPPSFDLGRNLYFLTKTENGWRVTNVMIHTKWPDLDDGTHNCYFSLARPANDEERKEFPKHCR